MTIEKYGRGAIIELLPDKAVKNHHITKRVAVGSEPDEKKMWKMGPVLTQRYGSCVGFGWTAEFIGRPVADIDIDKKVANAYGQNHWKRAQYYFYGANEFGENGDDGGTSLESGGRVAVERGIIDEYLWATSVEQIRAAVITTGPVVVCTNWVNSMDEPTRRDGRIRVAREKVNVNREGHCYVLCGYHPNKRFTINNREVHKPAFKIKNSWSDWWGKDGYAWMTVDDFSFLFDVAVAPYEGKYFGVGALPVGRNRFDLEELLANNPDPRVS